MIGDAWNTLVAPPTDRELDAAMAEVRVRAIGHARRGARRGRVLSLAGVSVALTLAVLAGRSMGTGLRLYEDITDIPGFAELGRLPIVTVAGPSVSAAAAQRFHVTMRTEMDGVVIGEGEAWIEGPNGTAFEFTATHMNATFQGAVMPGLRGESLWVSIGGSFSNGLGFTREGRRVSEQAMIGNGVKLRVGEIVEFYPFGRATAPGTANTVMRIEGPVAASPTHHVVWRSASEDTAGSHRAGSAGFEAAGRGVRYAVRGGALRVRALWHEPPVRVRVALKGNAPGQWVWASKQYPTRIQTQGLADDIRVSTQPDMGRGGGACVQISGRGAGPGARNASNGGCFSPVSPRAPIEIELGGRVFVVERS